MCRHRRGRLAGLPGESMQDLASIHVRQIDAHDRKVDSTSKRQQGTCKAHPACRSPDTCTSEAIKHMQRNEAGPFPPAATRVVGWGSEMKHDALQPPSRALDACNSPNVAQEWRESKRIDSLKEWQALVALLNAMVGS